jgi:hypothetical protein
MNLKSTEAQTIAIMAATIYAVRITANTERHRLDTIRRESIKDAYRIFADVISYEPEESGE